MDEVRLAVLRSVVGRERRQGADGALRHGEVSIALPAQVDGLISFEIVGITGSAVVFAAWDGRSVTMSQELYECALMPLAWERLVDGTGQSAASAAVLDDPRSVALQLVQHLDCIVRIEYSTRCDLTRKPRTWLFDASRHRQPSVATAPQPTLGAGRLFSVARHVTSCSDGSTRQ